MNKEKSADPLWLGIGAFKVSEVCLRFLRRTANFGIRQGSIHVTVQQPAQGE